MTTLAITTSRKTTSYQDLGTGFTSKRINSRLATLFERVQDRFHLSSYPTSLKDKFVTNLRDQKDESSDMAAIFQPLIDLSNYSGYCQRIAQNALIESLKNQDVRKQKQLLQEAFKIQLLVQKLDLFSLVKTSLSLQQLKTICEINNLVERCEALSLILDKALSIKERVSLTVHQSSRNSLVFFKKVIDYIATTVRMAYSPFINPKVVFPLPTTSYQAIAIISFWLTSTHNSFTKGPEYFHTFKKIINFPFGLIKNQLNLSERYEKYIYPAYYTLLSLMVVKFFRYMNQPKIANPISILHPQWVNLTTQLQSRPSPDYTGLRKKESNNLMVRLCEREARSNLNILLAPPGSGKTCLINGLAQNINEGNCPEGLKEWTVLYINCSKLFQEGISNGAEYDEGGIRNNMKMSPLDSLFTYVEGKKDVIVVFDEAHLISQTIRDNPPYIESLKTDLETHSIRAVFATTPEEYDKTIGLNTAFASRLNITRLSSLEDSEIKAWIRKEVYNQQVFMDEEAIDYLLTYAKSEKSDIASPRREDQIKQYFINTIKAGDFRLINEKQQKASQELERLRNIGKAQTFDPTWINTDKGKEVVESIKGQEKTLKELKEQQHQQEIDYLAIVNLKTQYANSLAEKNFLIQSIAESLSSSTEEQQKNLLILEQFYLPSLEKAIDETIKKFKESYQEIIPPLKITKEYLKERFPLSSTLNMSS